jgi:hypothetical protein
MPTNQLNGINLAQIAEQTLDYLSYEFAPLSALTRDFSEDIAQKGESITTRVPASVTAVDLSNGYTAQNSETTSKPISLSNYYGYVYGFSDAEVSKAGNFDWLKNIFMAPALEAVMSQMMTTLGNLVVTGTFTNTPIVKTSATFDADDLSTASASLSNQRCPKNERAALLNPDFVAALQRDTAIVDASAYGNSNAIQNHAAMRVFGFDVYEYGNVPANSQNIAGWALHPSALIMAARQPATPSDPGLDVVNTVTSNGLPVQFRSWYDPDGGLYKVSLGVLYGCAVGNPEALTIIKTS